MIRIDSDWKLGLDQSELGLIRVENLVSNWFLFIRIVASDWSGLGRIDFLPFFIKRVTKRFPDWFGMIRIGSDMDIGMNRNSSDWLGMNSYPTRTNSDWEFSLDQSELGLISVENLASNWFGFIQIVVSDWFGLGRIDFLPFFMKQVTKRFSDVFGMNRNSSDCLGMNSYPILSPGLETLFL